MVQISLKDTVNRLQPCYTESVILLARNSPGGENCVWIVVEGDDDIEIYEKFFDPDCTKVLPSEIDGKKGCTYLEQIVANLLSTDISIPVFGIRDADYTRYENPPRKFPNSVFATDYRDIETMMLAAQSVTRALMKWNHRFSNALIQCLPIARHIGYMRACNYLNDLGCNFKKRVKTSVAWDENTKTFVPDWQERLLKLFLTNCKKPFSQQQWKTEICKRGLNREEDLYICQGHDLLRLLQYTMNPNDRLKERMVVAYSLSDFRQTHLYKDISAWEKTHHVKALI